jgi:hypothetical protein
VAYGELSGWSNGLDISSAEPDKVPNVEDIAMVVRIIVVEIRRGLDMLVVVFLLKLLGANDVLGAAKEIVSLVLAAVAGHRRVMAGSESVEAELMVVWDGDEAVGEENCVGGVKGAEFEGFEVVLRTQCVHPSPSASPTSTSPPLAPTASIASHPEVPDRPALPSSLASSSSQM